jgi:hypothetical protein
MEEWEEGEAGMRHTYHDHHRCLMVADITYQAPNQRCMPPLEQKGTLCKSVHVRSAYALEEG